MRILSPLQNIQNSQAATNRQYRQPLQLLLLDREHKLTSHRQNYRTLFSHSHRTHKPSCVLTRDSYRRDSRRWRRQRANRQRKTGGRARLVARPILVWHSE